MTIRFQRRNLYFVRSLDGKNKIVAFYYFPTISHIRYKYKETKTNRSSYFQVLPRRSAIHFYMYLYQIIIILDMKKKMLIGICNGRI